MMSKYIKFLCQFVMLIGALTFDALAIREARSTSMDTRLRVITFNPNDVFKYVGYYGYQGSIEFEEGETIETISMGDTVGWQMVPSGHRLFLKPMEEDATTNMTLITNKRLYYFELHAEKVKGINDPRLVFAVKFLYPAHLSEGSSHSVIHSHGLAPDMKKPELYNFNYTISGSNVSAPSKVFDDKKFTYFQFKGNNVIVPAIFLVDKHGNESIVNYQAVGDYIAVENIKPRFTLRYGEEVTCVFNENMPFE